MNTDPSSRRLRDLPPRHIDFFSKAVVLFSGFMQQFGWIFFTMGSLFAWLFLPASTVKFWFEFGKKWEETTGKIISSEPTNASVNNQLVYSYFHSFEAGGERFTGKSYTTGQQFGEGQEVTIRYDAKNPKTCYIVGAQRALFPGFIVFVLIFPLIGLVFIVIGLRNNWKAVKLLEIGDFTRGKMVSKVDTRSAVKINGTTYPVYKYQFEFRAGGKPYTATCRTHQGWLVEDEAEEIILYDRFNPAFNLVFDAVANMPAISEQGMLKPAAPGKIVYLLLPILGTGLNVYFLLYTPAFLL